MSMLPFCTCGDEACPLNPVNHDRGCDFCVAKCLHSNEIPSCFFRKARPELAGHADWSFEGFAKLIAEQTMSNE